MHKVYVLNTSYECISTCSLHRALALLENNKAEVVKFTDQVIHTVSKAIQVPLIIKIFKFIRAYCRRMAFSTKLVWDRDDYTCQYCGKKITEKKDVTTDHIIPKSRGGKTDFENMVTACSHCNKKKNDRLPHEAKMRLIRKPFKPTITRKMKEIMDAVKKVLSNDKY